MTDKTSRNYLPLMLLVIGGLLIGGFGTYLLSQQNPDNISGGPEAQAQSAAALAGMSSEDRKATEAVVRAYILENPEIITEAVAILQSREMAKRVAKVGPSVTAPFAGDVAGNPSGDVTVVEFTDYNCGFCRATVADVAKLLGTDKNIKLIYRELPILAPSSKEAAVWALAAAKQGKHDAFHRAMFAAGKPDTANIRKVAASIGLDVAAAEAFAGSDEANAEIENNLKMAQQIGFNGTPTFVIGDQVLEGAQGYELLQKAVDKARKKG
jgi:protein-disulfide isomerase